MKILDLARPSWGTITLAALAGTAVGFAAGYLVGRDPAAARRLAGRATQWAATGVEQATLLAAQLREQLGDLWAEARESSLNAVDGADFERQAAAAAPATAAAATATASGSAGLMPKQPAGTSRAKAQVASKRRSKTVAQPQPRTKPRAMAKAAKPV